MVFLGEFLLSGYEIETQVRLKRGQPLSILTICAKSDDDRYPVVEVSHLRGAPAAGVNPRGRSGF